MNLNECQSENALPIKGVEAQEIGDEYAALIIKQNVTEAENERIIKILTLAIDHPDLEFWVAHADARAAKMAGLLEKPHQRDIENQKALLRERIGQADLPAIRGYAAMPPASKEEIAQEVQEQIELRRMSTVLEEIEIAPPFVERPAHHQKKSRG